MSVYNFRLPDDRHVIDVDAQAARFDAQFPKTSAALTQATQGLGDAGDGAFATGPKGLVQYVLGATNQLGETTEWSQVFSKYALNWTDNPVSRVGWAAGNMVYGILHLATGPETYDVRGVTQWGMSVAMLVAVPEGIKTGKMMARSTMHGVAKTASEATRLTTAAYQTYANTVNAVLESTRSPLLTTPGTPLDLAMRHPERGAVAMQPGATGIPTLIREASTAPWETTNGVFRSCKPYSQLLDRIQRNPSEIALYIEQIVEGIAIDDRMARPYQWLVKARPEVAQPHHLTVLLHRASEVYSAVAVEHLARTHPQFFEAAHIPTMINFARQARGETHMSNAMNHLVNTRPELFTAAHVPGLLELARTHYGSNHPLISLMARRPELFTSQHLSDIIRIAEALRTMDKKHPYLILNNALQPLRSLFAKDHVAAIAKLAKIDSAFAYALRRLADIRPDLEPVIIQELLDPASLSGWRP